MVISDDDFETIVVPERFDHVFTKRTGESEKVFAGMALPTDRLYDLSKEPGLLTVESEWTTEPLQHLLVHYTT